MFGGRRTAGSHNEAGMYANPLLGPPPYCPLIPPLVSLRPVARNALSIYPMYIRDLDVGELVGEVTRTR